MAISVTSPAQPADDVASSAMGEKVNLFHAVWRRGRTLLRSLTAWTGGAARTTSVVAGGELDGGGHAMEKSTTTPGSAAKAGLVVGVTASTMLVLLPRLFAAPMLPDIEVAGPVAQNPTSEMFIGIGIGLCAGIALSGGSGALPVDESSVDGPTPEPESAVARLALFRTQVAADVIAYDGSDVLAIVVAAFVLMVWHAFANGLTVAAYTMVAAAIGLTFGVAQGGRAIIFVLCISIPVAFTAGVASQCLLGTLVGACGCARFWIRFLQDKLLYHPRRYDANAVFQWGQVFDFGGQHCSLQKVSYSITGNFSSDIEQTAMMIRPEARECTALWVVCGGNAMLGVD